MHIISAALAALLGTFIGYMTADRAEERKRTVKAFSDDILTLSSQIEYTSLPLRIIVEKTEKSSLVSSFWHRFGQGLADGKGSEEAWTYAIGAESDIRSRLSDEEIGELTSFFSSLGKSDRDTETKNAERIYKLFERREQRLDSEIAKKKKMCVSLGALSGLAIAILII